ncbi:hypothetical protein AFK76_06145 [Idiomarina zobellii]|uniref:Uncharacterized protein n=1 Tax=Idiomarina zobellii TaxID=86103 RepID=A0A837NG77_9GAMM|nr:hypothetical protein AFK76_06145 [Idiomarina zobellii]SDG13975.1 hypothetical protein SAMN04515658_11366 [Idiomarina zobellii]
MQDGLEFADHERVLQLLVESRLVNVLPVAFSDKVEDLSERANFALHAFQVRELWYYFVEMRENPSDSFWLNYAVENVT